MKHYIIPVFIPHLGCLHECIFCNQRKITGRQTPVTAKQVSTIIAERLNDINETRWVEVAFYGGSFTALPQNIQNELLAPASRALRQGYIHAIRLSTRPDCINRDIITNLIQQGVTIVELGVQSLDNQVLSKAGRGHDCQAVIDAVRQVKEAGLQCGLQLMPGLPGEDWESLIKTVRQVIHLHPDFVRIYPTIVIADTALAKLYQQEDYRPLSLKQAVARAAYMKLLFERQGITVIRTGLQASEELNNEANIIAGPYHAAFGEIVDSYLFYIMMAGFLEQNLVPAERELLIRHHPQDCSKVRGQRNSNINRLKQSYNLVRIILSPDSSVKKGCLVLENQGQTVFYNKNMINYI
ncbi:elongator complex protein 3 [Sporomusa acidovorans]|uniref:Radical SAM core domain-containing protein n=1 Tax=Sporomusa acidovorans (strain ATCC 49682 / DSM 3132 / Mol) TaxID=1123286 RepID=A0ABZ3J312_SPOA4|nr:radical SAM protein [Sporomusa acidovorans]OZC20010.1 oxygen-independent coproporphyrinogen-III oxidase-like protein [Sporomusa acidovorans DSM 3132]SDD47677.1 Radical SAM superfamily protein [Sporomusa acidovorans]